MPNIKSAIKRVNVNERNRQQNVSQRSALRTYLKNFQQAVQGGNLEEAEKRFSIAVKNIDASAGKGLIHKNAAARYKSKMAVKLNQLKAASNS